MIYIASLAGFGLYVLYVWFGWSNKYDKGEGEATFKQRLYHERQELVAAFVGAILFMIGGEGLLDSIGDIVGGIFGDKWQSIYISIQVNLDKLNYVIGGASFGAILLWFVAYQKKKAKKKLEE